MVVRSRNIDLNKLHIDVIYQPIVFYHAYIWKSSIRGKISSITILYSKFYFAEILHSECSQQLQL